MTSLSNGLAASAGEAALQRRGLLLVAGAATVWSSGGLIVRGIEADPWTTILWRSIFGALFLLGFIAVRDRGKTFELFRRMGGPGVVVALCFAAASTSFVIAVSLTSVANTLIILSTSPLLAALLGRVVLGERVRLRSWMAMAAALVGIIIMVSNSFARGSVAGDLVAFIIPLAFAIAIVTTRRQREVRMTPATCLAAIFSALFALPFAAPLAVSASDMSLLVLFGAVQLGLGLILFTAGARLAPAAEVALVSVLETILGPLWVWIFLGENPGAPAVVGGVIVLAALTIHSALDLRQTRPVPPVV